MNFQIPHRRFNPLTGEWVLVSPQRTQRPWLGQVERVPQEQLPAYDPDCYLCPGNGRAGGKVNPPYQGTFVFDNDFPALLPPSAWNFSPEPSSSSQEGEYLPFARAETVSGVCRVVCFSPRHDLTLPELSQEQVEAVVRTWRQQTEELGKLDFINYVQVFENKGEMMGCSNPHPHSQIWATSHVPDELARELFHLTAYREKHASCLLCDVLAFEVQDRERLVVENEHFVVWVPFWAIWPFELLLLARRHCASLTDLSDEENHALANILRRVTTLYDNLFEVSFPYSMGFHQAPSDDRVHAECHLHAHFYPPLLRSATVRKFMVGFEMLAMPQRDLTPESAAERLRAMSPVHYKAQRT